MEEGTVFSRQARFPVVILDEEKVSDEGKVFYMKLLARYSGVSGDIYIPKVLIPLDLCLPEFMIDGWIRELELAGYILSGEDFVQCFPIRSVTSKKHIGDYFFYLLRFFDTGEPDIYKIGVSSKVEQRINIHKRNTPWGSKMEVLTILKFNCKETCLSLERRIIKDIEDPWHGREWYSKKALPRIREMMDNSSGVAYEYTDKG